MPTINWSSHIEAAGDATDEVLPKADYDFEIVGAEHRTTQTGKDMFVVRCRIIDGPFKGRVLYNNFVISPDSQVAMGIFFRHMKALGLGLDFFKSQPSNEQVLDALEGVVFRGSVGTETYQGSERNAIKNFFPATRPAGGGSVPPPPPAPAPAPPLQAGTPERAPF
jgi:hypothetical protein